MSIKIDVKPLFTQRNEVICAIDPQSGNGGGGLLHLDKGKAHTLQFNLDTSQLPGFVWDSAGAFAWDYDDCPGPAGTCPPPYVASPPKGSTLEVAASAVPQEEAAHYRLNFKDGSGKSWHFDPVIIRD